MNKKLIAAAIAAVVAAPAAVAADTTLYGKAHVFVASNSEGATDNYTVESTTSRLGVKGSEDLGNGLKAIFKYETVVNITDGGSKKGTFGSARNAYLGLSGGFGTVLAGRHDTPAKVALYSIGIDKLDGSIIDFHGVGTGGGVGFTERRLDNAIAYISPNFSGFTVAAATVPGEGTGSATSPGNGFADAYSLGLMYAGGGLKAALGYEVASKDYFNNTLLATTPPSTAATKDEKMLQLGLGYTFGDYQFGGNYQKTNDKNGTSGRDQTVWAVQGTINFGNNFLTANYGNNDDKGLTSDYTTYGVGLGHHFSKRSQVYVAYANQGSPGYDGDRFALGMIHTF